MKGLSFTTDPKRVTCTTTTLSRFTKQMSVLLNSGIPMHESLATLMKVQADSLSVWVTPEIYKAITNGHRFSVAISRFPRIFNPTFVALMRAAEETGKLVKSLEQLGLWLERRENVERHVKRSLLYPVMIIIVAFFLTMGLFQTVIPGILETIVGLGVELPWTTKVLLGVVAMVKQPLTWVLFVVGWISVLVFLRSDEGFNKLLTLAVNAPVLGPIIVYSTASRYAQTMSMLMDSGVDIVRASQIAAAASGNPLMGADSHRVVNQLKEGKYYNEILEESHLYPRLLVDMVRVGDESGKLARMMERAGEIMEQNTMYKVDTFLNLLEPLVLCTISLCVAFIIIAVLMPMTALVSAL